MACNIGFFEKEEEVVEAIRLLREAGVDHDEIRVIVNHAESAPIIAGSTDIPVEEVSGIREAKKDDPNATGVFPLGLAAVPPGTLGTGTPSAYPGAAVFRASFDDGESDSRERILRDVGIPGHAAERCGEEIGAGHFLLLADTEEDLNCESILRHAGASEVIH